MAHTISTWQKDALCIGVPVEECYPEDVHGLDHDERKGAGVRTHSKYKMFRLICDKCPVRRECRLAGLGEPEGMWGGLTPRERSTWRRQFTITNGRTGRPRGADEGFLGQIRERLSDLWNIKGVDGVLNEWPAIDHKWLHEDRHPDDIMHVAYRVVKGAATE